MQRLSSHVLDCCRVLRVTKEERKASGRYHIPGQSAVQCRYIACIVLVALTLGCLQEAACVDSSSAAVAAQGTQLWCIAILSQMFVYA